MVRPIPALVSLALVVAGCTTSPEARAPGGDSPTSATTGRATTTSTNATSRSTTTTTATTTPPETRAPGQSEALLDALLALAPPDGGPTRVGLVAHRASTLQGRRTIDVLDAAPGIELQRIFAPEHGLTGTVDAGRPVDDGLEPVTGIPIRSLYGERRAPEPGDLADLEAIVYDLQDVGVRAFTYIATMGLVMQAAASADVPLVIIDRTNPQGRAVDGPVRVPAVESFVSPYAIPPVYGLTSAELARLLAAEGEVDPNVDLRVVGPAAPLADPWIPPSPNLPTLRSTWLYPAVVLFEATSLSVGRGTEEPFAVIGGPDVDAASVVQNINDRGLTGLNAAVATFTPRSIPKMSVAPRYEGQELTGVALSTTGPLSTPFLTGLELLDAFLDTMADREGVIDQPAGFDRLTGDPAIRRQLLEDVDPGSITETWRLETEAWTTRSLRYRSP